ncbi:hypothetical protein ACH5RR_013806 [Cinchona calisaya]|uniref:Cytochrome P450 n=1 Tax=Cinchona calisaya TaxID=153742 RepID=A0ABD3A123_9GENT
MIKQRKIDLLEKNSPLKQDIMTHMLLTIDENGQFFNLSDIASHLAALLQGGYKTVHSTITLLLKYIAEIPDVYDRVLREQKEIADSKGKEEYLTWEDLRKMKYTWNAACEVLRLMPPGIGSFQKVDSLDVTCDAQNPEYFSNPEKFDPCRFEGNGPAPNTFVPFGGGSRMRPGNEYARLAILVFVHNVVMNFRWEKLIPDPKVLHDPVPRPAKGLPIFLYLHNP